MLPERVQVYLITDGWSSDTPARVAAALEVLPRGSAAVQLRAKALPVPALLEAALKLRGPTRARDALLLVNDRLDVALAAEADGVHLPAKGLPPKPARRAAEACGRALVVGCSTHSLEEARMAAGGGADFVTFGPVWPTPSKAAYGPPVGEERLAGAARALALPVFALGGIDAGRAATCRSLGARVACIGAVLGRPDAAGGARALARALDLG